MLLISQINSIHFQYTLLLGNFLFLYCILQYLLSCDCVILHCYHLIDKIRLSLVNITTPSQAERIFL
jgi:hypothetical protein